MLRKKLISIIAGLIIYTSAIGFTPKAIAGQNYRQNDAKPDNLYSVVDQKVADILYQKRMDQKNLTLQYLNSTNLESSISETERLCRAEETGDYLEGIYLDALKITLRESEYVKGIEHNIKKCFNIREGYIDNEDERDKKNRHDENSAESASQRGCYKQDNKIRWGASLSQSNPSVRASKKNLKFLGIEVDETELSIGLKQLKSSVRKELGNSFSLGMEMQLEDYKTPIGRLSLSKGLENGSMGLSAGYDRNNGVFAGINMIRLLN